MTNIEQIKREVDQSMTEYRHYRDNRDMARSIVNKTIDHLHSRGYFGVVPDGYVLVPKEPTYEMLMEFSMGCGGSYDQMKQNWPRMIVAAQKGETK